MQPDFDVLIVGGGHAGCEAAAAAARLGRRVALVTFSLGALGRLSCNPAIGGLAKGTLVREIDAMGGLMGRVTDASTLHFRRLNTRKGLAVQSSRAQVDVDLYPQAVRRELEALPGLSLIQAEASDLLIEGERVAGLLLGDGSALRAPAVILTTGTFLAAVMHCGAETREGGRIGEASSQGMAQTLERLGLRLGRLKTGTPPRLHRDSLDWSQIEPQGSMEGRFSFRPPPPPLPRIRCGMVYTNPRAHDLIRESLHTSAMYSGKIQSSGPRYCPSIEDKIVRFPERERHLLFLEPEGLSSERIYVNGLSTSLSREAQERVLRSIPGLEQAEILQYGYAVEYSFSDPRDLLPGFQHRALPGLYLAGQLNGTSGYEEAAAQGFIAGVSAALGEPLRLGRDQAYMGVLAQDLTTRGVGGEPYRMFSSRAEHRLLLREDNADRRLTPLGRELGLVVDEDWQRYEAKLEAIELGRQSLEGCALRPTPAVIEQLESLGWGGLRTPVTAWELLRRPPASYAALQRWLDLPELSDEAVLQVETDCKYSGYLKREEARARRTRALASHSLEGVDFHGLSGLSMEVRQRLSAARPPDLAAAGRLPGITPAALDVLAVALARRGEA